MLHNSRIWVASPRASDKTPFLGLLKYCSVTKSCILTRSIRTDSGRLTTFNRKLFKKTSTNRQVRALIYMYRGIVGDMVDLFLPSQGFPVEKIENIKHID